MTEMLVLLIPSADTDMLGTVNFKRLKLMHPSTIAAQPFTMRNGQWKPGIDVSSCKAPDQWERNACLALCFSATSCLLATAEELIPFPILAVVVTQRKGQCTEMSSTCITHFVAKWE